jgi:AcrR family transcriptional regulator
LNRQEQKLRTRRSIIDAAFSLLDEQRSLSSISLREVARAAGIAPTSFYRHFKDIDELGLTLVASIDASSQSEDRFWRRGDQYLSGYFYGIYNRK